MYKILIVEDDMTIAKTMSLHLEHWGYHCICIDDFRNITKQFAAENPHLVLMDISLPYFDGYHWCREIRRLSQVPIIFISSASDNMSIIMAVNMGGDDFIAKPFDLTILSAKVQALMRRTYDFHSSGDFLELKGVVLNLADTTVSYNENKLELSRNEFRIMQSLFENKNNVVSREKLMKHLWETDCFVDENTLTVNITRLRKKLAGIGIEDLIVTKKGLGYMVE